jgi:hypothetical protein
LTNTGTKQDVDITKEFTLDVYQTVKRIHNTIDQNALVAEAPSICAISGTLKPANSATPRFEPFRNRRWRGGHHAALDELLPLVYSELKRIAAACMNRERPGATLQVTGL